VIRILYVEDNDDNVYMLRNRLTRAGFTVVIATNGVQGVAMAASEHPDLIIMDLAMPGLDGWQAASQLKSDPKVADIPIIALTAFAMRGDEEKAREAGCDGYLSKPCRPQTIREVVRRYLRPE